MRVVRHGDAAEIVMSSPPVNAFSVEFLESLCEAVDSVAGDVGAVVVTTSLDRVYAAGGDLKFMAAADLATSGAYVRLVQETYSRFEDPRFVSIAAIDGACLAGGFEMALACDIRIASRRSRVGLPEVQLGIFAGGGAIHRLVRAVGQSVARDMLLTGDPVDAAQAHQWGLVTRLVDEDAAAAGRELARTLAAGSPEARAATKELATASTTDELTQGLADEWSRWMLVREGANAQAGLDSFADRRTPTFRR